MLRWIRNSVPIFFLLFLAAPTLVHAAPDPATLTAAFNVTSLGFRANEGGGGQLNTGWTGGNLGNTWVEGEWVPYQLVLTSVQTEYPNLVGMPNIEVSYDFHKSGARFVDLIRGLQVGRRPLSSTEGWPMDNGLPYPIATRAQIEAAQTDIGNAAPFDNYWQLGGTGNFQLLNLPNAQLNRALDGSDGTPVSDRRKFVVTAADLLAHGVPATADTIVIYYQLHESRTFVWDNSLQAALANPPTGAWGGYLYANPPFSNDKRFGSSYVPGSSGHVHLETLGGSQDVPIPIPERLPGAVSGVKWKDDNGNGVQDGGEVTLSGWRIKVRGVVDNINFSATTLTDADGVYSFPNLTNGTWILSEAADREVPADNAFTQTYPAMASAPVGAGSPIAIVDPGQADWGWTVTLTPVLDAQGDLDFGNRACIDAQTTDPADVTLCPGGTAIFTTTASGTGPFSFVWKKGAVTLADGDDGGDIDITTAGNQSTLTISNAEAGDAGTYSVEVTGNCGPAAIQSALLTVNENTGATELSNLTKCAGESAVFSTTASGTGPHTFVWKKGAVTLVDGGNIDIVNTATTSTLTLLSVAPADTGTYCVTVDGACGDPVQRCATLSVNTAAQATALADLLKCPGDDAVFSTTASGTGPYSFVWKKGANVLVNGGNVAIETNGATSQLTISGVAAADTGQYCVTVSGTCGDDVTRCAHLTVNENVAATPLADVVKCAGESAMFTTTASGTGPYTFVWKKGAVTLVDGGNIDITTVDNVSTLTLLSTAPGDAGTYCVTVDGACGDPVQRCAGLTVNTAVQATELGDLVKCSGDDAVFSTTASGTGPYTFVWKKGANVLANGGNVAIETNGATSQLTISGAAAADTGQYCVTVSGTCGDDVTRCAHLTVNDNVAATPLAGVVKCTGESAMFTTTASGSGPYTFVWKKGATTLVDGGNIDITTVDNVSTLTILSVAAGDAGTYCVTVSGVCGDPVQRCADLTVNLNVSTTDLSRARACEDSETGFMTTASGAGPYTFVWKKGNVVLQTGGNITIETNGNTSSLIIAHAGTDDEGTYCVTVSGSCGPDVTRCADLSVGECVEFCSLTQGFWGNKGGKQCFEGQKLGTLDLIDALITPGNPLRVGKAGRSLTVSDGNEECVIKRLPAGGTPATLPASLGDASMTGPSCTVPASMLKNGKFNNVLLGQTITLALNIRYDTTLGGLHLCRTMETIAAKDGGDGCLGSEDDMPDPGPTMMSDDDPTKTVYISPSVFAALTTLGLSPTPAGILELANCALAGLPTAGASLSAISGAADAINSGFDECRFLFVCDDEEDDPVVLGRSIVDASGEDEAVSAPVPDGLMLLGNRPNPFHGVTAIRFALPERSRVRITVFDVAGRKLDWSADREMEAGEGSVEWNAAAGGAAPAGIYFYRLETTGLESGAHEVRTGKMILAR